MYGRWKTKSGSTNSTSRPVSHICKPVRTAWTAWTLPAPKSFGTVENFASWNVESTRREEGKFAPYLNIFVLHDSIMPLPPSTQQVQLLDLSTDLLRNIVARVVDKTASICSCKDLRRLIFDTATSAVVTCRISGADDMVSAVAALANCPSLHVLSLRSKAVAASKWYEESSFQDALSDDVLRHMFTVPTLAALQYLDLSYTAITVLKVLDRLSTSLEVLYLEHTRGITDLTPVASLTRLHTLVFGDSRAIHDISPLSTQPLLTLVCITR